MACRGRKGKHHVFLRQRSAQRTCAHVVSHKDDILCRIRPQGIEDRVELCIAQDDEDHVVLVLRFQLRRDRNAADRHAGRKLTLDPKAVFGMLSLHAPRVSSVTSFPARKKFRARLQPSTPAPNTKIFIAKSPLILKIPVSFVLPRLAMLSFRFFSFYVS